jgi:serine/threonine protein kinase
LFELSSFHTSIVKAFEAGAVALFDGTVAPYLALEWLDGISLADELKHRRQQGLAPMTMSEVLTLLDPAAEGLAVAHARGVVHRDIKPGNLFLARQRGQTVVKILDFGVAKLLDDSMNTTTRFAETGPATSFTPMYAAPEQWLRRLGSTGSWTDAHALALVCVELLAGKAPLFGAEAAQFMAASLDAEQRPTPRTLGVEVSDAVEAAFARALAVNPRDRFRHVGEFWSALRAAAVWSPQHDACPIKVTAFEQQGVEPEPSVGPTGSSTTRATASRSIELQAVPKRRPWVVGSLGAGALLGTVVAVASLGRRASTVVPPAAASGSEARASSTEPSARETLAPPVEPSPTEAVVPSEAAMLAPPHAARSHAVDAGRAARIAPAAATPSVGSSAPPAPLPSASAERKQIEDLEQLMNHDELLHRR